MKIFIDTAKLDEIKEACSWGIIDGCHKRIAENEDQFKRS